ncbi:hypothetical protein SCHPADRAFT_999700 [Schizopora paradoxa]|uniref:Uncharacterized protein n=1 Tax=Schizopora paradoxa TaxID=27342 RepID=A0A0H2REF6_9AGAM|nr:hypothetical protein SCHPADRAFT_999700 [Schizopora paradoxa]
MAAFSRLQLAAALLEYDNDPDNPNAPRRSAQDSAIFSPLRRANGYIQGQTMEEATRTRDLLGVALPSEAGGSIDVKSTTMKSRIASVDLLQNPFGGDDDEQEPEPEEEALEVDLASWGLDSFMPKEKGSKASRNAKGKAKSEILPGTRNSFGTKDNSRSTRATHTRAMSDFGMGGGGAFLDSIPEGGVRRNSVSNPLDMDWDSDSEHLVHKFRKSEFGVIEDLPVKLPLHQRSSLNEAGRDTIPFPTSSSPGPDSELGLGVRTPSRLDERSRAHSNATMGATVVDENNPFSIPPPPEERASRFDPKYAMSHARTNSNATRLSAGPQQAYEEGALDERAASRMSGFTGKQRRDRRASAASFGTRDMLDDDDYAYDGFEDQPMPEKRYSRLDLMRPKVLIMPSPLQNENIAPPPPKPSRDGFLDSSDARPLPPGARSSRLSMLQSSSAVNIPAPGNSFTPNPRNSLSASQLLFRNNLAVDGQRDVTDHDMESKIRRAEKDGEKVQLEFLEDKPPQVQKPEEGTSPVAETSAPFRPAGKLFGRSLIDDLESRKQQMRNKQRVFYGDQRPSMMDRGQPKRSSTLIDPASLQMKPTPNRANSASSATQLQRKGSRGGKPLLTFGEDGQLGETTAMENANQQPQPQLLNVPGSGSRNSRVPKAHSVFGADKLWEREMERLEVIKAQEKVEEEERRIREEAEEAKKSKKKGRGKKKSKKHEEETRNQITSEPSPVTPVDDEGQQDAVNQPLLPDITKVTTRRRTVPVPVDDDSDDESSASEAGSRPTGIRDEAADKWVSDDEEGGKTKASTMAGMQSNSQFGGLFVSPGDDSDEDVPLSVALQRRASQNFLSPRAAYREESDSDEDRPLSTLLLPSAKSEHKFDFEQTSSPRSPLSEQKGQALNADDDEEEDNVPLGVRASRIPTLGSGLFSQSGAGGDEDEDERPLAMHPEQIRRSQFNAFAQMQQQQQMYEAQMRSSMMFNPMMMMPAAPVFAPSLPSQDNAKFGRVDRWRRDVAVEGEV